METYIILIVILLGVSSQTLKKYRSDYVYNRKTDAFYKYHTEYVNNWRAQMKCKVEGAKLMVPSSHLDIVQAHVMSKQFPDLKDKAWIGDDGLQHESLEEESLIDLRAVSKEREPTTCEVILQNGDIETADCMHHLPFICKVEAKDAPYSSLCKVHSKDYTYYENVGSCYKISQILYSWNQAYDECSNEGAHLIVLNSELEHQLVYNITNSLREEVQGALTPWFFLAGIRAEKTPNNTQGEFKTIFGQTLEEAGYAKWSANEPNNFQGREYCGSILKNDGNYNDLDCSLFNGFICENEVKNII